MNRNPLLQNGAMRTLVPGPSDLGFKIDLYLEHLEEASFLYEQRLFLLEDPELTWRDLEDFEDRFEAHIDALVLGGDLALAVCKQQARGGEFGELHAAVRVFCRQNRHDLFGTALEDLDPQDEERVQAVADALCHELPDTWREQCEQLLADRNAEFAGVAARALGYRRIPAAEVLVASLAQADDQDIPGIIWSLGRLRDPKARSPLYRTYLRYEDGAVRAAAAVALLRIGEGAAIPYCADAARSEAWALLPVGLGGSRTHVSVLTERAAAESVEPECMLALGLLGEVSGVDPLLYHLEDEDLAEHASYGLHLITGAELYEEILNPEAIEEDELFSDEREEWASGEGGGPLYDEPRGTTITRLSQQPDEWRAWWADNKARFAAGVRYRLGRPYSPESLLQMLDAEQSPRLLRRLAAEELVIRYGWDAPLENDMFVTDQTTAIARASAWLNESTSSFEAGKYYFAGKPQIAR